jgi:hypothetical protein
LLSEVSEVAIKCQVEGDTAGLSIVTICAELLRRSAYPPHYPKSFTLKMTVNRFLFFGFFFSETVLRQPWQAGHHMIRLVTARLVTTVRWLKALTLWPSLSVAPQHEKDRKPTQNIWARQSKISS